MVKVKIDQLATPCRGLTIGVARILDTTDGRTNSFLDTSKLEHQL